MSSLALPRDLPLSARPRAQQVLHRLGDRWLGLLAFVLAGYVLVGRGFAYLGAPPAFIGEITLVLGVGAMLCCAGVGRIFGTGLSWLLVAFCIWGACCTFPYIRVYGMDALRDGVSWGYCAFALITASLIVADPRRLVVLDARYRTLIKLQLIFGPLVWWLTRNNQMLPTVPGTDVPIIDVKGGDQAVHLTGAYAYLVGYMQCVPGWMALLMLPLGLALNVTGRAAMAAFAAGAMVAGMLLPLGKLTLRLLFIILVVLVIAWSLDLRYTVYSGREREVSVDQLIDNVRSTFGSADRGDMQGTKEWRLNWWGDIVDYTLHGRYFWTGKGFGINLATADGYQVLADNSLRNPHSAHLMYLARGGVPMFALWCVVLFAWGAMMLRAYLIARARRQGRWARLYAFLIAYWAALLVNASFDVFLEGPMGGIWFWSIFGFGMAALWIHKHQPEVLADDDERADRAQLLPAARR